MKNELRDGMDIYKYIMERPNVVKRLNTIIQDSEKPRIDLVGKPVTGKLKYNNTSWTACSRSIFLERNYVIAC